MPAPELAPTPASSEGAGEVSTRLQDAFCEGAIKAEDNENG
jgi:hypothetical protein